MTSQPYLHNRNLSDFYINQKLKKPENAKLRHSRDFNETSSRHLQIERGVKIEKIFPIQGDTLELTMDPRRSAQDVLRCDPCETPVPPYYCDLCNVNLCKKCAGEHLLDENKEHKVVPIKQRRSTNFPECQSHFQKLCELFCENCEIAICRLCALSTHLGHEIVGQASPI